MSSILAIYDLSGIQKFIFATNKMAEIIGASKIVHDALFNGIPDCLDVSAESWKKGPITFNSGEEKKIVYIGGGNALVLYDTQTTCDYYTKLLKKTVFEKSGGGIKLFSSNIELDETKGLSENQKRLMAKLDEQKKAGGITQVAPALPITAVDNNNYEPLILVKDGEYSTATSYAKLRDPERYKAFSEYLPESSDKLSFINDFGEKDREKDSKNYQAVIHIDGNTMGIKIREFVNHLTGSIWSQLEGMRDLSVSISNLYKDTLKKTIVDIYGNYGKKDLPLRPIVADGDDITLLMEASNSFDFVKAFIENLESKKIDGFGNFKPTAAAGIAFVTFKFPFSTAYEIAEACCKSAKAKTIQRCGGSDKFLNNPVSSMDYQMCYNNIPGSLSDYRRENYTFGCYSLLRRPYIFKEKADYSYYDFELEAKYWLENKKSLDGDVIARSKLKGLRNAYGISVNEAQRYSDFILSHTKNDAEHANAEKLGKLVFNDKKESVIFDWLDVMDIIWKEKKQ